jgi:hypothetical protein
MYDVHKHPMHTKIQQHTYRRKIHHILQCLIPLGVMVNYGDLQFAERIRMARRSEMSAEWKVRFAICIASVAIQAFTKGPFFFKGVWVLYRFQQYFDSAI